MLSYSCLIAHNLLQPFLGTAFLIRDAYIPIFFIFSMISIGLFIILYNLAHFKLKNLLGVTRYSDFFRKF